MTILFLKNYALIYSRRTVIIALRTSGIDLEIDALNILNKYIKLPVARYLNTTANLSLAEIACHKEVFIREINRDTILATLKNLLVSCE
jgi:hypothetical protein